MIDVTSTPGLASITINRPDKANSLTRTMLEKIAETIDRLDAEVRVLQITGSGRVFSAGADLDEARAGLATDPIWEKVSGAIADLSCLTVCAINGTLAGGAFGMALACDLRVCVPEARFFYPVMKLGFLPQPSDVARLMDLIGPAHTKAILMGGMRVDARMAETWGLVDLIAENGELTSAVDGLVCDARAARAEHVAAIKQMIRSEPPTA